MRISNIKQKSSQTLLLSMLSMFLFLAVNTVVMVKASAVSISPVSNSSVVYFAAEPKIEKLEVDNETETRGVCGAGDNAVKTAIDIGCKGLGNPILDALFAVIRFLTLGAGLVMIGSMIVAGIQYSASKGDPQATAAALKRIGSTFGALLLFIFIFAIANWLVPAGVLK